MNLLQMSFTGGVMIAVIVVLRKIWIHRLPKKTFLILWGIVLCRLLLPYELKSAVSVYALMPKGASVMEGTGQLPLTEFLPAEPKATGDISVRTDRPAQPGAAGDLSVRTDRPAQPEAAASFPLWTALWAAGVLLCLSYFLFFYIRGLRKFRQSLPVAHEIGEEWYRSHRLKRKLLVRQSDRITAPLTYGIFCPVILMPKASDWENGRQIAYILEHEYVHVQRFDAGSKLVMAAAACLHWFNPLVWVMYLLFNRDLELSCDETVIRRFGETEKAAYARLLIHMEEKKGSLAPFGSGFSKTAIEERITAIMKIKKASFVMLVIAAAMIASIAAVFATSAATDTREGNAVPGKAVPGTDFTDEEYEKLLALRYDGYERMSISDYQDRIWRDTDTEAYRTLLERFAQDETLLKLRAENELAGFLHDTLLPLCGDQWQSRDFSGGTGTDYPYPGDQACFEYVFTLTILDAEQVTVGAYQDVCAGMYQRLNGVLEGRTEEELRDPEEMERYLWEQTGRIAAECETPGLQITAHNWSYIPLAVAADEAEEEQRLQEMAFQEREEEWKKVLEPYLPLGLTYAYDPSTDDFKLYYQGKEAKSITDEQTGIWISEHSGNGSGIYAEDAVELFAVYEDGVLTGLREADEQEAAILSEERNRASAERDRAAADWEGRPPYGTEEDYESLLSLKTDGYQDMPLDEFNARLLEWADEDYDRMERVNMDTSWEERQVDLSEEEEQFVALTVRASGTENGKFVQSSYTGGPEEDPLIDAVIMSKSETENGGAAWCDLYFSFSYHIPDKSGITVGERDRCLAGMLHSVHDFWEETSLDELLKMEESDILAALQSFAGNYSSDRISVSIGAENIWFEKMDERNREGF